MRDGAVSDVDREIIGRIARASLRHEEKVPGPVVRRASLCDRYEGDQVTRGYRTLISIGFGVSLVAESDIGVTFAGLTYREVRDGTGPSQVNYSAHWRKDNDNPALANFLKLLSERYPLPCAG